jgi:hypothetical protein
MSKLPVTDKFIVYADIPVIMPKYLAHVLSVADSAPAGSVLGRCHFDVGKFWTMM